MSEDRQQHWNRVYGTKSESAVSWFQETPKISLDLLDLAEAGPLSSVIDIGGGASRLVDALLERGHADLAVLDLSEEALTVAQKRLGDKATRVAWIVADVIDWLPTRQFDIWHDRAAFHFLTEPSQQRAYVEKLASSLEPGGHAIIGTFAPDGPEKCSGLPVSRHSAASLGAILGDAFNLTDTRLHDHVTPGGNVQKFQFSTFRYQVRALPIDDAF